MKVFLTGGTGFIGQSLTKSLLAQDWEIIALVRKPDSPRAHALKVMGAQCVRGDVTDIEFVRASMIGVDVVIHSAGWYEFGVNKKSRQLMHAINVTGTENILRLALELGIPRTVYVSTTEYFGGTGSYVCDETYQRQKPCHTYYEQSKVEAHEIALQYQKRGLPLIIICPNAVVGPNDHSVFGYFLRMYLNRILTPFAWEPDVVVSCVHVDDVGKGIVLATEKGKLGETYILAGEPMSRREYIEIWHTKPGGAKVKFYIPNWLAKIIFAPLEPLQRLLGLPAFISRETVNASVPLNYSSAKAQRELGWTYLSARGMWLTIIEQELQLLASRKKHDLVSRLKPIEIVE